MITPDFESLADAIHSATSLSSRLDAHNRNLRSLLDSVRSRSEHCSAAAAVVVEVDGVEVLPMDEDEEEGLSDMVGSDGISFPELDLGELESIQESPAVKIRSPREDPLQAESSSSSVLDGGESSPSVLEIQGGAESEVSGPVSAWSVGSSTDLNHRRLETVQAAAAVRPASECGMGKLREWAERKRLASQNSGGGGGGESTEVMAGEQSRPPLMSRISEETSSYSSPSSDKPAPFSDQGTLPPSYDSIPEDSDHGAAPLPLSQPYQGAGATPWSAEGSPPADQSLSSSLSVQCMVCDHSFQEGESESMINLHYHLYHKEEGYSVFQE